ncbi:MAG: hypothetical protein BWY31_04060 [Lentisphaerae bacterium ADurb.Bin242]|nr:MAG: hypothetical protein BWY31_04060 [Lentisphaerae bacterium ADurb.Bin242]
MEESGVRQALELRFREYARSFAPPGEEPPRPNTLKLEHTFDVCALMDRIICGEPVFAPEQYFPAWLCALFHDVSRFEQYRDYRTFRDDKSFDHGKRSAEIFLRDFAVPGLPAEERRRVASAVEFHNKPKLPDSLAPEILPLARAVRDADKLSIMKLLNRHFKRPLFSREEAVNLGMPDTPGFTEELAAIALRGEPVKHSMMKNVNDFKITVFGWTSDVNFSVSARFLLEGNYYGELRSFLPESALLDELYEVSVGRLRILAEGREVPESCRS